MYKITKLIDYQPLNKLFFEISKEKINEIELIDFYVSFMDSLNEMVIDFLEETNTKMKNKKSKRIVDIKDILRLFNNIILKIDQNLAFFFVDKREK